LDLILVRAGGLRLKPEGAAALARHSLLVIHGSLIGAASCAQAVAVAAGINYFTIAPADLPRCGVSDRSVEAAVAKNVIGLAGAATGFPYSATMSSCVAAFPIAGNGLVTTPTVLARQVAPVAPTHTAFVGNLTVTATRVTRGKVVQVEVRR
jgi:hypothetical protein